MTILLEEMTRDDAREAFARGALVVLPTASTEQHGPHLPLMTDALIVTHVARAAGERAARRIPLVVAPTVHFGASHGHLPFAGTLSLTSATYMATIREIALSLQRHGVRRLVLVNGHGSNQNPNSVVAYALVIEDGLEMDIGAASYWTLAARALEEAGAYQVAPPNLPGHAGGFETSLVLALRPDLVRLDKRHGPLTDRSAIPHIVEHGAFERAGGITDDAARANADIGRLLLEAVITSVADYLVQFHESVGRSS